MDREKRTMTQRFSVSVLAPRWRVLETDETHIIALLNKKFLDKGERHWSAIGGAIELRPEERQHLVDRFGARSFEGNDARFQIIVDLAQPVERFEATDAEIHEFFFRRAAERYEADMRRELKEELAGVELPGQESPILSLEEVMSLEPKHGGATLPNENPLIVYHHPDFVTSRQFHFFEVGVSAAIFKKITGSKFIRVLMPYEVARTQFGAQDGWTNDRQTIANNVHWPEKFVR